MAVDRFTRFKILRALWARARALMASLGMPHEREARHRAWRWQQIQMAERYIRDGIVRGTGDPDAYVRPQALGRQDEQDQGAQAHWEAQRWHEREQRRWVEHSQRQAQHQGRKG